MHIGRNLLWSDTDTENEKNSNNVTQPLMCPVVTNDTEVKRINGELRSWIGHNLNSQNETQLMNTKWSQSKEARFPKTYHQARNLSKKQKKEDVNVVNDNKAVEPYSLKHRQYADLFQTLGDTFDFKNDTYYIFVSHEFLIPVASQKNISTRPKMSLVLPTTLYNGEFFQSFFMKK